MTTESIEPGELATVTGGQALPQLARICQDGTRLYEQGGQVFTRQDRRIGVFFTKRPYFIPVGRGKGVDDICPGQR